MGFCDTKWWSAVLVVVTLLAGCGTPATVTGVPTEGAAQAPTGAGDVTPIPGEQLPALLGYVGDPPDSPALFVDATDGLLIDVADAIYDPTGGYLTSYRARFSYPGGDRLEMEFVDITRDDANAATGFQVKTNAAVRPGPSPSEFVEHIEGAIGERRMVAFAPAWSAKLQKPGYRIFICTGIMAINYDIFEGHELVASQKIGCEGEADAYAFEYSGYTFDEHDVLTGFSVRLGISPEEKNKE